MMPAVNAGSKRSWSQAYDLPGFQLIKKHKLINHQSKDDTSAQYPYFRNENQPHTPSEKGPRALYSGPTGPAGLAAAKGLLHLGQDTHLPKSARVKPGRVLVPVTPCFHIPGGQSYLSCPAEMAATWVWASCGEQQDRAFRMHYNLDLENRYAPLYFLTHKFSRLIFSYDIFRPTPAALEAAAGKAAPRPRNKPKWTLDEDLIIMAIILINRRTSSVHGILSPNSKRGSGNGEVLDLFSSQPANVSLLFIVAILVAKKSLDDKAPSTKTWALVLGLDSRKLCELEILFLRQLDWKVSVWLEKDWVFWSQQLRDG